MEDICCACECESFSCLRGRLEACELGGTSREFASTTCLWRGTNLRARDPKKERERRQGDMEEGYIYGKEGFHGTWELKGSWRRQQRNEVGICGRMKEAGRQHGTASPCAACKLLRRRCAWDCVFAPHFPADEPQKFANVHRVFGASNVSKLLQEIAVQHRGDAVSSLVYEANARVRDPVYGCVGVISSLHCEVQALEAQLAMAQAQMVRLRMLAHLDLGRSPTGTGSTTTGSSSMCPSPICTPGGHGDRAGQAPMLSFSYER